VGKSAIPAAVPAPAAAIVSLPLLDEDCDLLGLLAGVPDGRTALFRTIGPRWGPGPDVPVGAEAAAGHMPGYAPGVLRQPDRRGLDGNEMVLVPYLTAQSAIGTR
jgi:hypothetical protein